MTTTAIIVEMLIIGFFSFIWLLLLIIRASGLSYNDINYFLCEFDSWAAPLTLLAIALFYQLGLIVNWISGFIVQITYKKKFLNTIFGNKELEYRSVRILVDQKGSDQVHKILHDDLSIVRLSRAGVINFLCLAIIVCFYNQFFLGLILLLFSILCYFQWYTRYMRYYQRILDAYKTISDNT